MHGKIESAPAARRSRKCENFAIIADALAADCRTDMIPRVP
jgi:hypothetical protein